MNKTFPVFPEENKKVQRANFSHDLEHGDLKRFEQSKTLPAWQRHKYMMGRQLSDRKIGEYQKMGYYNRPSQ